MRQEWLPEELIESWTLVEAEWKLIGNKAGATRLGIGPLLKFYEVEGRFPSYSEEVSVASVAGLLIEDVLLPLFRQLGFHQVRTRAWPASTGHSPSTRSAKRTLKPSNRPTPASPRSKRPPDRLARSDHHWSARRHPISAARFSASTTGTPPCGIVCLAAVQGQGESVVRG
ncbi:MAG: hypothetical protein ACRDS0_05540 [Pseudonocardiaceae bacterium]